MDMLRVAHCVAAVIATAPFGSFIAPAAATEDGVLVEASAAAAPLPDGVLARPPRPPKAELSRSSDTGESNHDGITADKTPTITGRADPGSTVVITRDRRIVSQGRAKSNGDFSIKLNTLKDGYYSFEAAQLIAPGTGVFANEKIKIQVDTIRPDAPKIRSKKVVIGKYVDISGNTEEDGYVQFYLNGDFWKRQYYRRGKWQTALEFETGIHSAEAFIIDKAGNEGKRSTFYFIGSSKIRVFDAFMDAKKSFVLHGTERRRVFGHSVSSAGDFNGDGFSDALMGAPVYDQAPSGYRGVSFIHYGGRDTKYILDRELPTESDGTATMLIAGGGSRTFGTVVAPAGDMNGDGFSDIMISERSVLGGAVYVVFGGKGRKPIIDVSQLNGRNGFVLTGDSENPIGGTLAGGGDVNGDGYDDIVVGPGDLGGLSGRQRVFVIFGGPKSYPSTIHLPSMNKALGFEISGAGRNFGTSAGIASDLNRDGFDDIVVTSPSFDRQTGGGGATTIVYGRKRFGQVQATRAILPTDGFQILGPDRPSGDEASLAIVSTGGDINGDGIEDLALSAGYTDTQWRSTVGYIVFGRSDRRRLPLQTANLKAEDGYRIVLEREGVSPYSHLSSISVDRIAISPDLNGDGTDDLLISAPGFRGRKFDHSSAYQTAFVVFGRKQEVLPYLHLQVMRHEDGMQLKYLWSYEVGYSMAGAGDMDADGLGDILIGAPMRKSQSTGGKVIGLYGKQDW